MSVSQNQARELEFVVWAMISIPRWIWIDDIQLSSVVSAVINAIETVAMFVGAVKGENRSRVESRVDHDWLAESPIRGRQGSN